MPARLKKYDSLRPLVTPLRGVLNVKPDIPLAGHARYRPPDDLADFVEHYCGIEWDLPAPQRRETLPHPVVYLVIEQGQALIGGPGSKRFDRVLAPRGHVFFVKFRPGAFRAFCARPVAELADRFVPLGDLFGPSAKPIERLVECTDPAVLVTALNQFLRECQPVLDEPARCARDLVETIATNPSLIRVEQLVSVSGIPLRRLQRLFREFVGVSPKWVIQRYRLHEVLERIAKTTQPDWASLALDLGYSDQAHFIRDFRKVIGRSPASYSRESSPASS